jgi:hypothetical protein
VCIERVTAAIRRAHFVVHSHDGPRTELARFAEQRRSALQRHARRKTAEQLLAQLRMRTRVVGLELGEVGRGIRLREQLVELA